jgi:hypothetical protein
VLHFSFVAYHHHRRHHHQPYYCIIACYFALLVLINGCCVGGDPKGSRIPLAVYFISPLRVTCNGMAQALEGATVYNSFLSAKTIETLFSQEKFGSIAHSCETAETVL